MLSEENWIEIKSPVSNTRWFVSPNSYALLSQEERERKWKDDVEQDRYPACLWAEVVKKFKQQHTPEKLSG